MPLGNLGPAIAEALAFYGFKLAQWAQWIDQGGFI